jgi:hypothetical protein
MGLTERSELERHIIMRGRRAGKSTLSADVMSLEDMLMKEQAKAMEQAINFEVLAGMLVDMMGWTRVEISRDTDNHHAIDIREWVAGNCKHETQSNGTEWLFENAKEAMWFKLRWL